MKLRVVQHAQAPGSRSSSARAAPRAARRALAVKRDRDRVDGEVSAQQILLERAGCDLRQRAGRRVALGAPGGDIDPTRRPSSTMRGAEAARAYRPRVRRAPARRRSEWLANASPSPRRRPARAALRRSSRSRTAPPTSSTSSRRGRQPRAARAPPGSSRTRDQQRSAVEHRDDAHRIPARQVRLGLARSCDGRSGRSTRTAPRRRRRAAPRQVLQLARAARGDHRARSTASLTASVSARS